MDGVSGEVGLLVVWWHVVVGGARLVSGVTTNTRVAGTRTGTTLSTAAGTLGRTLVRNSGVRLMNFNAFDMGRHPTHRNVGPTAGRGVRVTTGGITGFGTNTRLTSTLGGWLLELFSAWGNVPLKVPFCYVVLF